MKFAALVTRPTTSGQYSFMAACTSELQVDNKEVFLYRQDGMTELSLGGEAKQPKVSRLNTYINFHKLLKSKI